LKAKKIIVFILLGIFTNSVAQNAVKVHCRVVYDKEVFRINKWYLVSGTDSIRFEILKFYISDLKLLKNNKVVAEDPKRFHLIDFIDTIAIPLFTFNDVKFDELTFDLGIDSITNVSGAMGGDLDPMRGMYWTWQSGYINLKLEGFSAKSGKFEFHLGGYQFPFNALQHVRLKVRGDNNSTVNLDIKKFIDQLTDTKKQVMSPSAEAVKLSHLIANCFYIE
jgi:hypothetical protein